MAADDRTPSAVYALKQRLEALESEKSELLAELTRLQRNQDAVAEARAPSAATGSVNAASDAAAKIKLFRSLFRGRDEVFPRRWQNANSGKSGYSPVCRNEWARGICEKPRVKCGECPHQAFVPVTDDVIRCHLQGTDRDASGRQSGSDYIAGVYPNGNLEERNDLLIGKVDTFTYDALGRLDTQALNGGQVLNLDYAAGGDGNIAFKTGVGTYATYGGGTGGPHAVTSITGLQSNTYVYDANGNMTNRDGDTITWFSHNRPKKINYGAGSSEFWYGTDRSRYKQVAISGGTTATTRYFGPHFEVETRGGLTIYRHYVFAGGQAVAQYERRAGGSPAEDIQYLHRDQQANVVATTNAAGTVRQRWEYDAFGWRSRSLGSGADDTERGYTGHEHLDAVELTHMNGRVQDPELGRFISADPFVQAPYHSQSLNRYSYAWNNPLTLVDPSGFQTENPYENPGLACFLNPSADICRSTCFRCEFVDIVPIENTGGPVFGREDAGSGGGNTAGGRAMYAAPFNLFTEIRYANLPLLSRAMELHDATFAPFIGLFNGGHPVGLSGLPPTAEATQTVNIASFATLPFGGLELAAARSFGTVAAGGLAGFTAREAAVIAETSGILASSELAALRAAHAAGRSASVSIGGRTILYEPGLSASAMTLFGDNGFVIGRGAFSSSGEFGRTVLHELYRLSHSASAGGVSGALATQETAAAAGFAERAAAALGL